MRQRWTLSAGAIVLLAVACAGQVHSPTYILGGTASTLSTHWNGVWIADLQAKTLKHLTPNDRIFDIPCAVMDADNRRIVFTVDGTRMAGYATFLKSGVYRLDPATLIVRTVATHPTFLFSTTRLLVNQDGDYVVTANMGLMGSVYNVVKVSSMTGAHTTLFGNAHIASAEKSNIGINMDTGNYLVTVFRFLGSPTYPHTVMDVAEDGSYTTFAGARYGWDSTGADLQQNFESGAIEGQADDNLYRLMPGAATRTTLTRLSVPKSFALEFGSLLDLQSAPFKRIVASGHVTTLIQNRTFLKPAIFTIDARPPYACIGINCDPLNQTGYVDQLSRGLGFYRGRHLQTAKLAPGRWSIRLSCPDHPGKAYVLVLGAVGYRPGIKLPDGRTFHLNFDAFFALSMANRLRPYFDPGPLRLNGAGDAVGQIDVGSLPPFDIPVWIAAGVLDPSAPSGIACLPDTYVMRLKSR